MMEIPLEKEAVFMDPTQTLELAQALKLSPTLLQSMNILQMTTMELSAYLKDLALENPVLEEQEGGTSWEEFAHQVSWLADRPGDRLPVLFAGGTAGPVEAGPEDPGGVPLSGGPAG